MTYDTYTELIKTGTKLTRARIEPIDKRGGDPLPRIKCVSFLKAKLSRQKFKYFPFKNVKVALDLKLPVR